MTVKQLIGLLATENLNAEVFYPALINDEPVMLIVDTVDAGESWEEVENDIIPPRRAIVIHNLSHFESFE